MLGRIIDGITNFEVDGRLDDIEKRLTLVVTAVLKRREVAVVDRIVEKMWQIRSVAKEQYNPEYNQLKHEQKVWLLDEHKDTREVEDDWLEKIGLTITQFIFHGYEKILAKKAIKLGDGEHDHMASIVKKNKEALR